MVESIVIKPGQLSYEALYQIYYHGPPLSLDESAYDGIHQSHQLVNEVLQSGKVVYGINTGFGQLASKRISEADLFQLQHNIVVSHASGVGKPLSPGLVRLILALKINSLARGYSGVRLELIERLLFLYNQNILPVIPEQGSVGASGDLVPLAHMALAVIGIGDVLLDGKYEEVTKALERLQCAPLKLVAKEGLALLNGMQVSNAICLQALFESESLFNTAMVTGCLSVDALCGSDSPFDERIQAVRGHQGQIVAGNIYRHLMNGSEIRNSHSDCDRVQDPYSLRGQPQVMGACYEQIANVKNALLIEANAVSDNPLVFVKEKEIISGGNFHGEIIAINADNLAIAISEIGAISERRIALLTDVNLSTLPAFLVKKGGLNSGFMAAQYTAAAMASDNKVQAHPHSVDSLPTSANQEDHVSMAANAARRLLIMLDNSQTILAIELLAACQGLEFRLPLKTSPLLEKAYQKVREKVPPYDEDRYMSPDIRIAKQLVCDNVFNDLIPHV